jgi:APA family basic amino acid/polyamine antiporter
MGIWDKKTVDVIRQDTEHSEFHKTLTAFNLVLLGIGGIIGAGIFVLTGQAAAQYAGPAIVISFLISGFFCGCAALCYAELASIIPASGSAYTYAYATFGKLVAWIIGWDLLLEYLFGSSTVAVGWSGYVSSFLHDLGYTLPPSLSQAPFVFTPGVGWSSTGAWLNLPASFLIIFLTALVAIGIRESASLNNLVVLIKVSVLLVFLVFGAAYITRENLTPFIPENTGISGHYGWSGIFRGAAVIFFAYIGFDCLSTLAQETKNPQRDLPKGIIGSLIVCTILYVLVAFVLTGMVHYSQLNVAQPIAVALDSTGGALRWFAPFIKIGAIAGLSTATLGLLLSQPRILYTMSKDGLLPKFFSTVHPRTKTPFNSTLVTGALAAIVAGLFPIGLLGELVSIGTLLAFFLVCVGVLILRKTEPNLPRPFKVPAVGIIATLGALGNLGQMIALPLDTWIRLGAWLAIGLVIFFLYSNKERCNIR